MNQLIGIALLAMSLFIIAYFLYIAWNQDEYCRKKFGNKFGFQTIEDHSLCVANDGSVRIINE